MRHSSRWSQVLVVLGLATLLAFAGARAQLITQLSFTDPYNVSHNSSDNNYDYSDSPQSIVDAAGNVSVVWVDWTTSNIMFRRSSGAAFSASPVNVSQSTTGSYTPVSPYNPRLAVEGDGTIDVVWLDVTDQNWWNYDVFFARSTDGTATKFSDPVNLSNNSANYANPQIAVDGSNRIHVVWENDTTFGIFHTVSSDAGTNWLLRGLVSTGNPSSAPALAAAGDNVYVAWKQIDPGGLSHIAFSRSTDGGANFLPMQSPSGNPTNAFGAKLAVDGSGNPYLAWIDNRIDDPSGAQDFGNFELIFSRSTDQGASFSSPAINVSNNAGDANDPQMATDATGNVVYVAWRENSEIWFAQWTNGDPSFSSPVNVSKNDPTANPDIRSAAPWLNRDSGGNINVAWQTSNTALGFTQVWFAQSSLDGSINFTPQVLSRNNSGSSQDAQVLSDTAGNINVVWSGPDTTVVPASNLPQILFSRHAAQKVNQPPTANAGPDQPGPGQPVIHATSPTTVVTLDGSGSSDPDGDTLTYVWKEGGVEIANGKVAQASLPRGLHTITLTVSDSVNPPVSDDVQVTITDEAPVVTSAGQDQTVTATGTTTPVTLTGSATDADDAVNTLTFVWKEGGVDGVEIANGASATANLTVGSHTITLTVFDPAGRSSGEVPNPAAVTHVTINPKPLNHPPTATVGPDQTISCAPRTGATVNLSGSASDPDGDTLGYLWTDEANHIVGTTANVQGVIVPAGRHAYTLTVADPGGLTATATTQVIVNLANPPALNVAVSPNVLWPPNHKMVQITASIGVTPDACDPNPVVKLVSITRSDGNTSNNIQILDERTFLVRSENSDTGGDLLYTITYAVTDKFGNCTKASAQVRVSKDSTSAGGLNPGNKKGK